MLDRETGEIVQRRLAHPQQAREFYRGLPAGVRVGIESTGYSGWFERLLETLGHQVWMGDATQIRASMTRKHKTDKRDAEHIVKLLVEGRFPRIWVPAAADRDARQLLVHRHKLVQWQTQVKNQLQFLALNQGLQLKWRLWTRSGRQKLEALPLARMSHRGEGSGRKVARSGGGASSTSGNHRTGLPRRACSPSSPRVYRFFVRARHTTPPTRRAAQIRLATPSLSVSSAEL